MNATEAVLKDSETETQMSFDEVLCLDELSVRDWVTENKWTFQLKVCEHLKISSLNRCKHKPVAKPDSD